MQAASCMGCLSTVLLVQLRATFLCTRNIFRLRSTPQAHTLCRLRLRAVNLRTILANRPPPLDWDADRVERINASCTLPLWKQVWFGAGPSVSDGSRPCPQCHQLLTTEILPATIN
jgi:hypothetical protein